MPQRRLHCSLDVEVPTTGLLIRDKFHIIPNQVLIVEAKFIVLSWWRSTVVERRSLTGELSLSCARPADDG